MSRDGDVSCGPPHDCSSVLSATTLIIPSPGSHPSSSAATTLVIPSPGSHQSSSATTEDPDSTPSHATSSSSPSRKSMDSEQTNKKTSTATTDGKSTSLRIPTSSISDDSSTAAITTTFSNSGATFTTIFTPSQISSSLAPTPSPSATDDVSPVDSQNSSDGTPSSIWIGSVTASVSAFLILIGLILWRRYKPWSEDLGGGIGGGIRRKLKSIPPSTNKPRQRENHGQSGATPKTFFKRIWASRGTKEESEKLTGNETQKSSGP